MIKNIEKVRKDLAKAFDKTNDRFTVHLDNSKFSLVHRQDGTLGVAVDFGVPFDLKFLGEPVLKEFLKLYKVPFEDEDSEPYLLTQVKQAGEGNDWTYGIALQLKGSANKSKWLSISKEQYGEIVKIFK